MTTQKCRKPLGALAAALLFAAGTTHAADAVTYWAQSKGSKATVSGDSTMHAWKVEATLIGGTIKIPADFPLDGKSAEIKTLPEVNVRIPVRNMKSGKEKMDNVTMQAMNQPKHKYITYKLTKMTAKAGKPMEYDTQGDITINGVTKNVAMPVKMEPLEAGKQLKVTGEVSMKMSDFKVVAPKLTVLGVGLVVDDKIKVSLDWLTSQR